MTRAIFRHLRFIGGQVVWRRAVSMLSLIQLFRLCSERIALHIEFLPDQSHPIRCPLIRFCFCLDQLFFSVRYVGCRCCRVSSFLEVFEMESGICCTVAKRRVGACRERGGGSGRGAVVLCLRCTAAAPAGVGVVGGRRAGLIRRWRGRRASLTPRSTTARATRVTSRSFTPQ